MAQAAVHIRIVRRPQQQILVGDISAANSGLSRFELVVRLPTKKLVNFDDTSLSEPHSGTVNSIPFFNKKSLALYRTVGGGNVDIFIFMVKFAKLNIWCGGTHIDSTCLRLYPHLITIWKYFRTSSRLGGVTSRCHLPERFLVYFKYIHSVYKPRLKDNCIRIPSFQHDQHPWL